MKKHSYLLYFLLFFLLSLHHENYSKNTITGLLFTAFKNKKNLFLKTGGAALVLYLTWHYKDNIKKIPFIKSIINKGTSISSIFKEYLFKRKQNQKTDSNFSKIDSFSPLQNKDIKKSKSTKQEGGESSEEKKEQLFENSKDSLEKDKKEIPIHTIKSLYEIEKYIENALQTLKPKEILIISDIDGIILNKEAEPDERTKEAKDIFVSWIEKGINIIALTGASIDKDGKRIQSKQASIKEEGIPLSENILTANNSHLPAVITIEDKKQREGKEDLNRNLENAKNPSRETMKAVMNSPMYFGPQFYRGVIATGQSNGGFSKGFNLEMFINSLKEQNKWNYKYLFFIDDDYKETDNESCIKSVKIFFEKENIPGEIFWMPKWKHHE